MLCFHRSLKLWPMKRYTSMHPLSYLRTRVRLSDKYPTGLEWASDDRYHKTGDMAGVWNQVMGRYMVCVGGERYHAHRIVYYLRTETDPGQHMVLHKEDNLERDNRQELVLQERKETKKPKAKRSPFESRPVEDQYN